VTVVLDSLAAGIEEAELRREYPSLPPEAIRVALSYAADLAHDRLVDLPV
jgi:uncharacterized protein (DUF433 family)